MQPTQKAVPAKECRVCHAYYDAWEWISPVQSDAPKDNRNPKGIIVRWCQAEGS